MNILLIGSGGREHAIARSLSRSASCTKLFIAPGNPGTASVGENVALDAADHDAVIRFCAEQKVGLVVVGPEAPLVEGLADALRAAGVPVCGPGKAGAVLEGSKDFSKRFMQRHGIPTAAYRSFVRGEESQLRSYLSSHSLPIVVKASGLAAGKGVVICSGAEEAEETAKEMLSGAAFGDAGSTVVIESYLQGIEVSVFVLTDGNDWVLLPEAKDYKRIGEGDTGPNTGGMGAVSPVPFVDAALKEKIRSRIIEPTLKGLREENIPYRGFIFFGLMICGSDPFVIEYNCRMGDPETEAVFPRIKGDTAALLFAAAEGNLAGKTIENDPRTCVTVMLVSGGYPGAFEKGKAISGIEDQNDAGLIFTPAPGWTQGSCAAQADV